VDDQGASGSLEHKFVDFVPVPAIVFDADGLIADVNPMAVRLLGSSRDALVGTSFLSHLDPSSQATFRTGMEGDREEPIRLRLAAEKWVLLHLRTRDSGRRDGVMIDLTSSVVRELELEQARASAESEAHSKTEFLARLSHEVRSALASMVGFADMLRENVEGENRHLVDIIIGSGRHILDTLNSVMDLARLEFTQGDLSMEIVDVVPRVRDRITVFGPQILNRDVDLSFTTTSREALASLNPTFLDRIVHNLVDNAIKYTLDGKIDVMVKEREGGVSIVVSDTGIGIGEKFLPRLFSPFERERREEDTSQEGVGLGLAITKFLTELMGGRIAVTSSEGGGSTFTVTFPSQERPPQAEEE
jgi:signal transduction histidine kinase